MPCMLMCMLVHNSEVSGYATVDVDFLLHGVLLDAAAAYIWLCRSVRRRCDSELYLSMLYTRLLVQVPSDKLCKGATCNHIGATMRKAIQVYGGHAQSSYSHVWC